MATPLYGNINLQGSQPSLQGGFVGPILQPAVSPRGNNFVGPILQPAATAPTLQPAATAPRLQPAATTQQLQPAVGGVPTMTAPDPMAGMTFGFMDGSQYNQQGAQLRAPTAPAPTPYTPSQPTYQPPPPPPVIVAPSFPEYNTQEVKGSIETANLPPSVDTSRLAELEKLIAGFYQMSPEEQAAQEAYNNQIASRDLGIAKQRAIIKPMDLIRGGSQNILENSQIQEQTLQQKLALAQAKRQSALDASKFALGREDEKIKRADELRREQLTLNRPIEVGPGSTLVNPSTGKSIFSVPATPSYQANPLTGELFNTKDGSVIGGGNNNLAATLAQAVQNNPAAYDNLTSAQKTLVNNYLANQGQNIPGAPPTDTQYISANYGLRIQQSTDLLNNLSNSIVNYNPIGFEAQIRLPSWAQSSTIQSYAQAARNFINAVLRRESGAVISDSEFSNAYQQYLPRPGDSPQVLQQKAQNRQTVLSGFINASGSAWSQLTGQQSQTNPNDPLGIKSGFSSVGNTSASNQVKGWSSGTTPYLKTLGSITAYGSAYWSKGLDVDLTKGQPVYAPVTGTVIAAAPNGGFGNQIKIRTSDGNEIWLSHLDRGTVKIGQLITPGMLIGYGGNTGNVYSNGGDGSHLDITMKNSQGQYLSPQQVKSYLDNKYI